MASVLIVEDSEYQRRVLVKMVHAEGYETLESGDGLEGLKMILERKPDCILLDILLPGSDGLSLLRILKAREIRIPTIIVTADIQESTYKECMELGAFAVTHKPPKSALIKELLRKAIESNVEDCS